MKDERGNRGLKDRVAMDGADILKKASAFPYLSSGSDALDALLGGGYRAGRLLEIFGRSNSGKTQIAMQAALCAARKGDRSLFVDTEGSFRPERIEEIARARGWKSDGVLDKIVYLRADSVAEQAEAISRMNSRQLTAPCKLVVVDTLTRNYSLELPGRSNLANRQGALDVHLSEMARDAFLNERAYLLTNRVTFGSKGDVEIGGRTVEQLVHAAARLERDGTRVKVTLLSTGRSASLQIGAAGVK
ncbi:MAG: AAA family ATPase [Thaumarchaeota archaeon]|nr:AAA family ATPase [Nitrososphaerota archaeon]